MTPRKIILKTHLSPGDLCTLTAAIESLHTTYPGQFITDVRTSCDALFEHNPRITKLADGEGESMAMHYSDLIDHCDTRPNSFLRGYCHDLGKTLGVPLDLTTNRPHLFLSHGERNIDPIGNPGLDGPGKYWILTAGIKCDFTLKQWPVEYYQEVVDHFQGRIRFVQIGSVEHDHPSLERVVNLVGQTDARQLMRWVYHAQGGLGPITFLQHLCAAFEKPYLALLGGREPVQWTQYPLQTTFHTLGKLPCCQTRSCWRSRVVRLNDNKEQDNSLCDFPVTHLQRPVGKCMAMIKPIDVIRAMESFFEGGTMSYLSDAPAETSPTRKPPSPAPKAAAQTNVAPSAREKLELVAHSAWGFATKIIPAGATRPWMDTPESHLAYHCLPMVIANQSGWLILAPHGVIAEWDGGPKLENLSVEVVGTPTAVQSASSVGSGILTWMIPYVFRTPLGWNLLCRGPANVVKDGVAPLEGLIETDWTFASFSMNWKLTRPGRVEFKEGEPIAMLVPQRRADLEAFEPRFAELRNNPELERGYTTWINSRNELWDALKRGDPDAARNRFQKHYTKGMTNAGVIFPDHQKSRRLSAFAPAMAGAQQSRVGV